MLPKTYRKVIATRFSKNFREAAKVVEVELQPPGSSEILVKTHYAGVNATDVNISAGTYTPGKQPPIDLGAEVAGEVVAVGEDVENFRPGDLVVTNS